MSIRTFLVATALVLSACGSDSDPAETVPELINGPLVTPPPTYDEQQLFFLQNNAARDEVTVTASGLQYEVLRAADGPKPSASSTVTLHYAGELIDGTEFDSSYGRGEPATFVLGGTIPGFSEGVQLMSVGAEYRLFLPSEIAYGDQQVGEFIQPNSTLIFDIELLEINAN